MTSDSPAETLRERSESLDWYEKQRQLNQTKTYTAAELSAMNRKFSYGLLSGLRSYLRSLG